MVDVDGQNHQESLAADGVQRVRGVILVRPGIRPRGHAPIRDQVQNALKTFFIKKNCCLSKFTNSICPEF